MDLVSKKPHDGLSIVDQEGHPLEKVLQSDDRLRKECHSGKVNSLGVY